MKKYLNLFINQRPLTKTEIPFVSEQSEKTQHNSGLIGYLRADFGESGKEFSATWFNVNKTLKTDDFNQEFEKAVRTLRQSGNGLDCLGHMQTICYNNDELCIDEERFIYGMRYDTLNYSYLLKLCPEGGNCNCYIYCYLKDELNNYLFPPESVEVLFTFGSWKKYPYNMGYVSIFAPSVEVAVAEFKRNYPNVSGNTLNCADYYFTDEEVTRIKESGNGSGCHRIIVVNSEG